MKTPTGFNCVHPLGPLESIRAKMANTALIKTEIEFTQLVL
jgi:hypothetical protein